MSRKRYSKTFKLQVVNDALQLDTGQEYMVAKKYNLRESTVVKWKMLYEEYGEIAFRKNFSINSKDLNDFNQKLKEKDKIIFELEEEIKILKKAAAFLAELNRN